MYSFDIINLTRQMELCDKWDGGVEVIFRVNSVILFPPLISENFKKLF